MKIAAHRLRDAAYVRAHASGGDMIPTLIIIHDTAGRLDKFSSVNWFKSEECTTSAHVVVELDGTITQMVDFNKRAWHAGASEWNGKSNCNTFSIGIEIVNPGKLDKDGRAWFHKKTEKGFTGIKRAKTTAHGDGWWLDYTPEQLAAVTALCKELVTCYPSIDEIVTHWMVSPKRKIDTGPLFPLDVVRQEVFTVDGIEADVASVQPAIVKPVQAALQNSRTIFRALAAAVGFIVYVFNETVSIALAAVAQFEALQPVTKLLTAFGISVAGVALVLAFTSLGGVVLARLSDAAKGRN